MSHLKFREFVLLETTISQWLRQKKQQLHKVESEVDLTSWIKAAANFLEPVMHGIPDQQRTVLAKWMMVQAVRDSIEKLEVGAGGGMGAETLGLFNTMLEVMRANQGGVRDFVASKFQVGDAQFKSQLNSLEYKWANLQDGARLYHASLTKRKRWQGEEGTPIVEFPDGWAWVSLGKGFCSKERDAMGHCGNVNAKPDDNIFSLRDDKNRPYLTFIENKKALGEMKGRNNDKPVKKYHPYIIKLLESPFVQFMRGGGYLQTHNFDLKDLTKEQRKALLAKKPQLVNIVLYFTASGLAETEALLEINRMLGVGRYGRTAGSIKAEKFDDKYVYLTPFSQATGNVMGDKNQVRVRKLQRAMDLFVGYYLKKDNNAEDSSSEFRRDLNRLDLDFDQEDAKAFFEAGTKAIDREIKNNGGEFNPTIAQVVAQFLSKSVRTLWTSASRHVDVESASTRGIEKIANELGIEMLDGTPVIQIQKFNGNSVPQVSRLETQMARHDQYDSAIKEVQKEFIKLFSLEHLHGQDIFDDLDDL